MIAAGFLHSPSTLLQETGSYDAEKVGLQEECRRAMTAATAVLSPLTRSARRALRRRERVGWHEPWVVCELCFFAFCFLGIDLRSAEGQSPPTRTDMDGGRTVAGRQGSLWSI